MLGWAILATWTGRSSDGFSSSSAKDMEEGENGGEAGETAVVIIAEEMGRMGGITAAAEVDRDKGDSRGGGGGGGEW